MSPLTYARGKRFWRHRHEFPFELNDSFQTPQAAVLPSPQLCEPGPGSWLVSDADLRMSVPAGGGLLYAAGGADWDRCMLVATTPFARRTGRYLEFELTPTGAAGNMRAGWNFNQGQSGGTGANAGIVFEEARIYVGGGGYVNVTDGLDVVSPLYPYSLGTSYTFRVYDTGSGWLYYVCPTAALAANDAWTLLWERTHAFPSVPHFNPSLNNLSQAGSVSHVFVRQGLAKPPDVVEAWPNAPQLYQGPADSLVSVELTVIAGTAATLYFRQTDGPNTWYVYANPITQQMRLGKIVAGVLSDVSITNVRWRLGAVYRISALCFGPHIRTFFGINSGPSTDDAFNQTAGGVKVLNLDFAFPTPRPVLARNLTIRSGGRLLLN